MKDGRNRIILLNADTSVMHFISFARAMSLFVQGKAIIVEEDPNAPIIHKKLGIRRPLIVMLKKYIYIPFKAVKMNRRNILSRDGYICQYCGDKLPYHEATIDHVIPKSHRHYPGHNVWENVVAACRKCNNRKDNKTPEEAGMKLLRKPFTPKIEDLLRGNEAHVEALKRLYQNGAYASSGK